MRNRYSLKVEGIKHVPEDEQHEDVDFTLLNPDLDSENNTKCPHNLIDTNYKPKPHVLESDSSWTSDICWKSCDSQKGLTGYERMHIQDD